MTFKDLLIKWNGGNVVGIQSRFARKIGCGQCTVRTWIMGKNSPNVDIRSKVAQELGITVQELMAYFKKPTPDRVSDDVQAYRNYFSQECEEMKEMLREIKKELEMMRKVQVKKKSVRTSGRVVRVPGRRLWPPIIEGHSPEIVGP